MATIAADAIAAGIASTATSAQEAKVVVLF